MSANFLYLQVPVLARVSFPAGPVLVSGIIGPEFGLNLSDDMTMSGTFFGETYDTTMSAELKTLDVGLTFGLGLRIPMGSMGLFIEPSYYLGLTNTSDTKDDPSTPENEEGDIKHRNIKIKVGIYKDL